MWLCGELVKEAVNQRWQTLFALTMMPCEYSACYFKLETCYCKCNYLCAILMACQLQWKHIVYRLPHSQSMEYVWMHKDNVAYSIHCISMVY